MSVEANKAVVERYHEILNERKVEALEALGEVLAEDYADHSEARVLGQPAFRDWSKPRAISLRRFGSIRSGGWS